MDPIQEPDCSRKRAAGRDLETCAKQLREKVAATGWKKVEVVCLDGFGPLLWSGSREVLEYAHRAPLLKSRQRKMLMLIATNLGLLRGVARR
jgi:hypothetical protein